MAASTLFTSLLILCAASLCLSLSISNVEPGSLSTTSTTKITVHGANLLGVQTVFISGVECDIDDVDASGNFLTCVAYPGVGSGNEIIVFASGNTNASAKIVNFAAATATLCAGSADDDVEIFVARAPNNTITICGANFGEPEYTTDHSGWNGNIVFTVGNSVATLLAHTDDYLVIQLPQVGFGAKIRVKATFGTHTITIPGVSVTFAAPQVTGYQVDPPKIKRAALKGIYLAIYGANFGTPSPLIRISATVGGFKCVGVQHVSDSEIRCTVTGRGANQEIVVVVNGQSSASSQSSPLSGTVGAASARFDFPDSTVEGLACIPPYGAADAYNPELCNCYSGHASSTPEFTDCDVHTKCAGRTTTQTAVSQFPASRPKTEFKNDQLHIKQQIPIVKNRRDTIIQFVVPSIPHREPTDSVPGNVGEATCFFPGNLWKKTVNDLDCFDEFTGVIPWTQHSMCGFVEDTDGANLLARIRVFKANLATSYTETFKRADGSLYFRKVTNTYLVSVSFVRQVVALTAHINAIIADEKEVGSLQVTVVGDALYDVASKDTIIEFQTTIVWPYKLDTADLIGTFKSTAGELGLVEAVAELSTYQSFNDICSQVQDTDCTQHWILTVKPLSGPQVCNLKGGVTFNTGNLLCRDYDSVHGCDSNPNVNFTINIGKTDLCDKDAKDVDASAGLSNLLESFVDSEHEVAQNVFQTGDMIYFTVTVKDPVSTIDEITFNQVLVTKSDLTSPDTLYQVQNPRDSYFDATTVKLTTVGFNVTKEVRQPEHGLVSPNTDAVLAFEFKLSRTLQSLLALSSAVNDGAQQLTVSVTIDLFYHGNQKRTIVARSALPSVSQTQISFFDIEGDAESLIPETEGAAVVESDDFTGLFSSASSVVASVAVVAVSALLLLA